MREYYTRELIFLRKRDNTRHQTWGIRRGIGFFQLGSQIPLRTSRNTTIDSTCPPRWGLERAFWVQNWIFWNRRHRSFQHVPWGPANGFQRNSNKLFAGTWCVDSSETKFVSKSVAAEGGKRWPTKEKWARFLQQVGKMIANISDSRRRARFLLSSKTWNETDQLCSS